MRPDCVVLAFSGSPASCAAVRWLMDEHHADVVALVVDVGQLDDLEEVQTRAVACGAIRAHVVDRCDTFARDVIAPAVASSTPLGREALAGLAHSTIAAALVEVATIEGARIVAHASADDGLDEHIARLRPILRVIAPAREWTSQGVDVADYLRTRRLSPGTARIERHLLIRKPASTASGCEAAQVTIGFENGIAAYVNGVSMGLSELIESLSLIGSRYGLAEGDPLPAPALGMLQAAYQAAGLSAGASAKAEGNDTVTLLVRCGSIAIAGPASASAEAAADKKAGDYEGSRA